MADHMFRLYMRYLRLTIRHEYQCLNSHLPQAASKLDLDEFALLWVAQHAKQHRKAFEQKMANKNLYKLAEAN